MEPAAPVKRGGNRSGESLRTAALFSAVICSTIGVLVVTVGYQLEDENFVALPEAVSLMAGDHPYRDFFEAGFPLWAYLSAAMQTLTGYRLIGEFILHWTGIVAGVALSVQLAVQRGVSRRGAALMLIPVLILLAATGTYHYSKLLMFPLAIWVGWRYLDCPSAGRALLMAVVTVGGFLLRHDFGIYVGFASGLAFVFTRLRWRDIAVYGATVMLLLAPWALAVQRSEGLSSYVQARGTLYETPERQMVYSVLLSPFEAFRREPVPSPRPAVVGFVWRAEPEQQRTLESKLRLRSLNTQDSRGRSLYEVSDVFDPALLQLDPYIADGIGFEWEQIRRAPWYRPAREKAAIWLEQVMLVAPLALLFTKNLHLIFAALVIILIELSLFRQPNYMVVVAPLVCALSGALLRHKLTWAVVALSSYMAFWWALPAFPSPSETAQSVSDGFRRLVATRPEEYAAVRECTRPGDRLLVTGVTPFKVNYYAQRPMAGGHLYWRTGWRSDPAREAESLGLLLQQSVPLAVSTRERLPDAFRDYPRIAAHLAANYTVVERTDGLMLVDTRRADVHQCLRDYEGRLQ